MFDALTHPASSFSWKRLYTLQAWTSATAILIYLGFCTFLCHLLVGSNYGFFRDELYYIDAGRHLSWGYVEFPLFIGLLAALIQHTFGNVLLIYHLFPALAGAMLIIVTGLIARELGGGRLAQSLAALASLCSMTFLGVDAIFSMDSFDELWWALAVLVLIRLIRYRQPRSWLLLGLIVGMGLLTKLTIMALVLALLVGLLLTPERKILASKWLALAVGIALLFLLPYILWNATNGWPTLEFWSVYGLDHSNTTDIPGFLAQQILTMNPLTFPLWLLGLYALFFRPELRTYRVLGWAFLLLYIVFTLVHAKVYFLSPAYPMLFAAGALLVERTWNYQAWRWLSPTWMLLMALVALVLSPIVMPILPPASYATTMAFVGGNAGVKVENRDTSALPQQLSDRFGWETMSATVAQVYHSLTPQEQSQTCILTMNFGEAAALDLYGSADHLPPVISGHNTYYLWGPGNCTGKVIITVGYSQELLQGYFDSVTQGGLNTCTYCMPSENDQPIYICRNLHVSMQSIWKEVKHYN